MSDRILKYKDWTTETTHRLWFETDGRGSGYSFDCDPAGNVDRSKLAEAALANLDRLTGEEGRVGVVQTDTQRVRVPGLMKCDCGRKIELWDHHDVDCDGCGRSYNSSGQMLAPRSQWGEETGETAADWDAGIADGEQYTFDGEISYAYTGDD